MRLPPEVVRELFAGALRTVEVSALVAAGGFGSERVAVAGLVVFDSVARNDACGAVPAAAV